MKRLAALLGVVCAGLSALVVRPVNSYRGFMLNSTATAQTPALTVLGAFTAVLGALRRSRFAMITGVLGASVGTYYVTRVTASHDGLERAFGPDWKQRIRPDAERGGEYPEDGERRRLRGSRRLENETPIRVDRPHHQRGDTG